MRIFCLHMILMTAVLFCDNATGGDYVLSAGEGHAEPSTAGQVSVSLSSGSDVASVEFQVNYDPAIITLTGVTNPPGCLGEAFSVDYENDGGRAIVRMYRADGLVSGTGVLCRLQFTVNSGAKPAMWSELAVANLKLYSQFGADIGWGNTVAQQSSRFWVAASSINDSDQDGLSDYEEQMYNGSADYVPGAGDLDMANQDSDSDTMPDGWEFQRGLNAAVNDALLDTDGDRLTNREEWLAGTDPKDATKVVALSGVDPDSYSAEAVLSWNAVSGVYYSVYTKSNLLDEIWITNIYKVRCDKEGKLSYTGNIDKASLFFRLGSSTSSQ